MASSQNPAEIDQASVNEFIKGFYIRHPGASPGINFRLFKTSCREFKKLRYGDIKAWFKARPQAYTVLGQLVVPHGIVAEV